MQRGLTRIGLYKDKIDGKAGMQTRAALGAYQKSAGLKVDCWPSEAVLRSIERGALIKIRAHERKTRPSLGRASIAAHQLAPIDQISSRLEPGGSASRSRPR